MLLGSCVEVEQTERDVLSARSNEPFLVKFGFDKSDTKLSEV